MEYIKNSLQHVKLELERIALLVKLHVHQAQQHQVHVGKYHQFSQETLNGLLEQPFGMPKWAENGEKNETNEMYFLVDELQKKINEQTDSALQQKISLRLIELASIFKLSSQEIDILLICLAPELDSNYYKLYAYLQEDDCERISVNLILNILSKNFNEKMLLRKLFKSNSPLLNYQLIEFYSQDSDKALINRSVKIADRVIAYLLEQDAIDKNINEFVKLDLPKKSLDELILQDDLKKQCQVLIQQLIQELIPILLNLQGEKGIGKYSLAEAICQSLDKLILTVDMQQLLTVNLNDFSKIISLIYREALLNKAAIYWENYSCFLDDDDKKNHIKTFEKRLNQYKDLIFIANDSDNKTNLISQDKLTVSILLPRLLSGSREKIWDKVLQQLAEKNVGQLDIIDVANRFQLTPGQIFMAANEASNIARWRDIENHQITLADLYQACRAQGRRQLSGLAKQIKPTYKREDIILPAECQEQLEEILAYSKYYSLVYEKWGFAKKLSTGKGLVALFAGPPGTGKTMAAEIIASSLNLDLYKIDLSSIVSKYVGETEKNLKQIFEEAENNNIILFFDEADALFGKRTEIKNSHDRYANIEASYLLQRIESYSGIVILATNNKRNMDEAFVRRLQFSIDFPFPGLEERLQIWQTIWPPNIKLSEDVDLKKIAKKLEFAGGNIRNIALAAAFRAASEMSNTDKVEINLLHLLKAAYREYKKIGRVISMDELEKNFHD